ASDHFVGRGFHRAAPLRHPVQLCGRDVPPPHEALERRAVNTESLGRVADIPAVLREGLLEKLLFPPLEGHLLPAAERVPVLSSASHNDLGKLLRRDNRYLELRDGPF